MKTGHIISMCPVFIAQTLVFNIRICYTKLVVKMLLFPGGIYMKKLISLLLIVFLLSGCSAKTKSENLVDYTFEGLSYKISKDWTFDEEWLEDNLNDNGTSRFYNGVVTENVVSFDLKEVTGGKDKKSKKDLMVDKFSFENSDGMGSASRGKWKKSGETEYYIENIKYEAFGNKRKGKNIIIPAKDYKSCYVIFTLCNDDTLMKTFINDFVASISIEEQ